MTRTTKKKAAADVSSNVETMAPESVAGQQAAPAVAPQSITVMDIQKLAAYVDVACRRGAFGAAEAGEVGSLYNKVTAFLNLVASQQKDAQGEGENNA